MELLTGVQLPAAASEITWETPVMFLGSCFANEIGYRMAAGKLPVMTNPHGTLFNPFSVAGALDRFITGYIYSENDIYLHQDRYLSLDHHTAFSSYERDVLVERLNGVSRTASAFIRNASFLFVTFGTSYIYTLRESGVIVANCHKLPSSLFTRRQAAITEIVSRWKETLDRLHEVNPALRVWFTVSPVRHLSDGAHANQLSKAQLLLAVEELLGHPSVEGYFPAYEIFMDELRDYRYYAADMVHPSETAIDYIWEKFCTIFISGHTLRLWNEAARITRAMAHRITGGKPESAPFANAMLERIADLRSRAPFLNLEAEEKYFRDLL
ncbi:MAG: GSCFA domain-containing protein [Bacteroidota bacterium]|nr:GSCFA domain-containing protein [Bacteroidota bacterium]